MYADVLRGTPYGEEEMTEWKSRRGARRARSSRRGSARTCGRRLSLARASLRAPHMRRPRGAPASERRPSCRRVAAKRRPSVAPASPGRPARVAPAPPLADFSPRCPHSAPACQRPLPDRPTFVIDARRPTRAPRRLEGLLRAAGVRDVLLGVSAHALHAARREPAADDGPAGGPRRNGRARRARPQSGRADGAGRGARAEVTQVDRLCARRLAAERGFGASVSGDVGGC